MGFPELVLHVGSQQTGATMLRRGLARLRPQLHRHGIGLIGHPALAALAVDGWRHDGPVDPATAAVFERGLADAVDRELAAVRRLGADPRAIVVSSDQLLGRRNLDRRDERTFRPEALASVAQVVDAVSAPRARLLLYVRRQDRLMEACYLRALANGASHALEEQFPRRFEPVLDHLELVGRLEAVGAVGEVRVRPFELVAASPAAYVDDVLTVLGLRGRLDLRPVGHDLQPYRLYSDRAAAIARDVNPHLGTPRERHLARRFLLREFPGTSDASTRVLTDDERARILAAYAPVNRQLFAQRMPDLPADAYDDDPTTARLLAAAPTTVPSTAWTARAAVRPRVVRTVRRVVETSRNVRAPAAAALAQLEAQVERDQLRHDRDVEVPRSDAGPDAILALRSVLTALEGSGIPYLIAGTDDADRWRIAVAERHRRRTRRAVRELVGTVRLSVLAQDGAGVWGVRHLAAGGERAALTIEFRPLDPTLPGRMWQERWQAGGAIPPRGRTVTAELDVADRRVPIVRRLAPGPEVDEVTFPIDVVYTWVDGTDPRWLARKRAALGGLDPSALPVDASDASRFHSYDELRYSLRSVAMYADFVRHVYVVTDRQVPPWLHHDHHRLTVVDHRDIFPAGDLPTFNSHAIESRLHHIDGLAEHYLYLNDDFFLARPVTADLFFHPNGITRFFPSPTRIPTAEHGGQLRSVDAAARNTRDHIHDRFGRLVQHKIKHAPYPQRRSVLFELEGVLREEFARTAAARVRSPDDIAVPSSLYHYYAYVTGRAVPGRIRSRYVSLGEPGLARHLRSLRGRRDFDVLCINDAVEAHDDREQARRRRVLARFMASTWPTPSPFER